MPTSENLTQETTRSRHLALFQAVFAQRDPDRVSALIGEGCDVNAVTPGEHVTLLMFAAMQGCLPVVEVLCRHGAVINVKNAIGETALSYAASNGHLDTVRFLLGQGAFPETLNNANQTPAMIARTKGYAVVADFLGSLPPSIMPDTLEEARGLGLLPPGVAYAFRQQSDVLVQELNTDLTVAAFRGDEDWFHELVRRGASLQGWNERGFTVLMQAAAGGHIGIVTYLLNDRINVNTASAIHHETALMLAARQGHLEVVRMLLDHGAMVNAFNSDGKTAFMMVSGARASAIGPLLIARGACPDHLANNGLRASVTHYQRPPTSLRDEYAVRTLISDPFSYAHYLTEQKHYRPERPADEKVASSVRSSHTPPPNFQARLDKIKYEGEIPEDYCCPISQLLINDPVAASSGIIYDRASLVSYFESKNNPDKLPCPITKTFFISKNELQSQTNVFLKGCLEKFVAGKEKQHAHQKKKDADKSKGTELAPTLFSHRDLEALRDARMKRFGKLPSARTRKPKR